MGQALRKSNNYKTINKIKSKKLLKLESKEEYFIHNGGILLEKRIALGLGKDLGTGQVKILLAKDIKNATYCYEPGIIPHEAFNWKVYKAKSCCINLGTMRAKAQSLTCLSFIIKASTSMVMNHENIASMYGSCLETCIPILVYNKFLQNLYEHLHGLITLRKSLKWVHLLAIAAEVSHALSYMHNALSKPVVHRDVQSHVILLDDSVHAKLCGFGYSVPITPDSTNQRCPIKGTPRYVNSELIGTQVVTEKCDVYSFRVLMLEMLIRRHPTTMLISGFNLVDVFILAIGKNYMMEIVDSDILEQASVYEIEQFTQPALTYVKNKGVDRSTMV